jgi:hypothetical protein
MLLERMAAVLVLLLGVLCMASQMVRRAGGCCDPQVLHVMRGVQV